MAVDTIIVSDATKTAYLERYPASFQKGYAKALEFGSDKDFDAAHLFLAGEPLKRIRKAVGATFDSGDSLAALVEKATRVKIAGRDIALTPGQKQQLESRAKDAHVKAEDILDTIFANAIKESLGLY